MLGSIAQSTIGHALKQRITDSNVPPLRNLLVRRLLLGFVGVDVLEANLDAASQLVRNWDELVADLTADQGREFDARIRTWLAEVRAVRHLRDEIGISSAIALPPQKKRKRPDFQIEAPQGIGLAEVKSLSAHQDASEVIRENIEILAVTKPALFCSSCCVLTEAPELRRFDENDWVGANAVRLLLLDVEEALNSGGTSATVDFSDIKGSYRLRIEIEPSDAFGFVDASSRPALIGKFLEGDLPRYRRTLATRLPGALEQMLAFERDEGRPYAPKVIVVYADAPGNTILIQDEVRAMYADLEASLQKLDPSVRLIVRD